MVTITKAFPLSVLRCVLAMVGGMTAVAAPAQEASLVLAGYQFAYRERIETAPGDLHGETTGQIVITRLDGNDTVYLERTHLRPGCGSEQTIARIGADIVALCGHQGGRHYTKKLFRLTPRPVPLAQIDYFDTPAAVTVDPDGKLRTRVLRRDLFGLPGPVYFPFVHVLNDGMVVQAFAPDFSAGARPHYLDYYQELKRQAQPALRYREMAAALVATGNSAFACRELAALQRALPATVDLAAWLRELPAVYPAFDGQRCPGH